MTPSCLVSATGRRELPLTEEDGEECLGQEVKGSTLDMLNLGSIWRVALLGEVGAGDTDVESSDEDV